MDTWSLFRGERGGNKHVHGFACMVVSKPLHIMVHVVEGSSHYDAHAWSELFDLFKAFVYTQIILK